MIFDQPIRRSLLVASIYLLTAVVLNELRHHHVVSAATTVRLLGMLMGTVALVSANAIPKRLVLLVSRRSDSAREQTVRRFAAWALVLTGLGFTLAYALAPIAIASTLANCLLTPAFPAVVGVVTFCVWTRHSARRSYI